MDRIEMLGELIKSGIINQKQAEKLSINSIEILKEYGEFSNTPATDDEIGYVIFTHNTESGTVVDTMWHI